MQVASASATGAGLLVPRKRILAVVPCANEELAIGGVVLRSRALVSDVLVIDDGSTDRTTEVARLAGATIVQHSQNLGKGAAIRTGLRYARANGYDALVLLDGDGQHDPTEIPRVLAPILEERADVVIGSRSNAPQEMPAYRRLGKRVLDVATSVASGGGRTLDSQSGFRALGRKAIEVLADSLRADGFEVESEMIVLSKDRGLVLESVPIQIRYRGVDGSTQSALPHGVHVLDRVIGMLTMRRPLLILGVPGFACVIFGAYWGFRMLGVFQAHRVFVTSYGLAAATFVILGGMLLATALMLNLMLLVRNQRQ